MIYYFALYEDIVPELGLYVQWKGNLFQIIDIQGQLLKIECKHSLTKEHKYILKYHTITVNSYKNCKKERRIYINGQKKECASCGSKEQLTFHHKLEHIKKFTLGKSEAKNHCIKEIQLEIAKCIVLCDNCHFAIEYGELEVK